MNTEAIQTLRQIRPVLSDAHLFKAAVENPSPQQCIPERGKKIFITKEAAETFERFVQEKHGNQQQYAYPCPHDNHFHLTSKPLSVTGAPTLAQTRWLKTAPTPVSQSQKIIAALERHNGTKTAKEIAAECGVHESLVYTVSRSHDLSFKFVRGRRVPRTCSSQVPVTLQAIQSKREQKLAELRGLDEQEQRLKQQEEERKRVQISIVAGRSDVDGDQNIFVFANGTGTRLSIQQCEELLSRLSPLLGKMRGTDGSMTGGTNS